MIINRSIKIEDGKLMITENYAEKNLSKVALSFATRGEDGKYLWNWGQNAAMVMYEIPNVFNVTSLVDIMRELSIYCEGYINKSKLTDAVIFPKFLENMKK